MRNAEPKDATLNEEMHAAFLRRRRMAVLGVAGFILLPLGSAALTISLGELPKWLEAAAFFACMGLFLLGAFSWRCPRCGYFLASTWRPRYCWQCGVRLC
jgi:hypothetical protein